MNTRLLCETHLSLALEPSTITTTHHMFLLPAQPYHDSYDNNTTITTTITTMTMMAVTTTQDMEGSVDENWLK